MPVLTYDPEVFSVASLDAAKRIILTQESADATTEARWQAETPYLTDLILGEMHLGADDVVIDYGCGVGRVSKALIERTGCWVMGVDISPNMRALAAAYVASPRFGACAPEMLEKMTALGLRATAAISIWVLQHCFDPAADIARIRAVLAAGSSFLVVNNRRRAVPTREAAWTDDGQDIASLVASRFDAVHQGSLDPAHVTETVTNFSFWASYRKRNN